VVVLQYEDVDETWAVVPALGFALVAVELAHVAAFGAVVESWVVEVVMSAVGSEAVAWPGVDKGVVVAAGLAEPVVVVDRVAEVAALAVHVAHCGVVVVLVAGDEAVAAWAYEDVEGSFP
jgi:hypothetical protein